MRHSSQRGLSSASDAIAALQRSSAGGGGRRWGGRKLAIPAAALAALGAAAAAAQAQQHLEEQQGQALTLKQHLQESRWLQQLAGEEGTLAVLDADSIQRHPLLRDDHMFIDMLRKGVLKDLACFYNSRSRKFHTVIQLGREVCGFPRIVHGGLTASIMDETFGFLLFALKQHRQLPFWGPAYTAHLEVDYKAKIAAGSTILCTCSVEKVDGRKLWMTADLVDGPSGKVYARSRALFVAPKPDRLIRDAWDYLLDLSGLAQKPAAAATATAGAM